jgi:aminoglycoside phosphotransferase (APT) family kinase protein
MLRSRASDLIVTRFDNFNSPTRNIWDLVTDKAFDSVTVRWYLCSREHYPWSNLMSTTFAARCRKLLKELGLGSGNGTLKITPLAGGVSSDIGLVELGPRKLCVKFALAQLKVEEQWFANPRRNLAEYEWLKYASTVAPGSVPELLGRSDQAGGFVMEFIDGDDVYLWKNALLEGRVRREEALKAGATLARIHSGSSSAETLAQFQNQKDFHALRLEPYLLFMITRHPDLASEMRGLVDMLTTNELVVIHGDVSPKNIIFRNGVPMFLDAECATAGDPAFDVAFCLNHLVLKALHLRSSRKTLFSGAEEFWSAYRDCVDWEPQDGLERRVCRLLPAFMLARVDGKSPVEYLSADEQRVVRSVSTPLIKSPESSVTSTVQTIYAKLENYKSCRQ